MSDTTTVACTQCGSAVPRHSPFCLVCGTPLASRTHAAALGTPVPGSVAVDTSWRPAPAEEPIPRSSVLRAEYGWRILAWFADSAITALLGLAVTLPILSLGALRVGRSGEISISIGPLGILLILLGWYAYPIAMLVLQAAKGFSLGMLACGLRLVDDATLRQPGLGRVVLRDLVVFAGRLVFGIGELVVYLSPLWDSSGRLRGWHDKAAGTWLIDVRRGPNPVSADPSRLVFDEQVRATPVPAPGSSAARTTTASAAPAAAAPAAPAPADPAPADPAPAAPAPATTSTPSFPPGGQPTVPVGVERGGWPERPAPQSAPGPAPAPPSPTSPSPAAPATAPAAQAPTAPGSFTPPPPPSTGSLGMPALIDSVPGFSMTPTPPRPAEAPAAPAVPPADVESTRLSDSVPGSIGRATASAAFSLDTGQVIPVATGGVIGRDPVAAPGALAIPLPGDALSVSKTHLEFGFDGTALWVLDRNSTNGTSVIDSRGFERVLTSGTREVVADGDRVRIGTRSFTVRLGLRSS